MSKFFNKKKLKITNIHSKLLYILFKVSPGYDAGRDYKHRRVPLTRIVGNAPRNVFRGCVNRDYLKPWCERSRHRTKPSRLREHGVIAFEFRHGSERPITDAFRCSNGPALRFDSISDNVIVSL